MSRIPSGPPYPHQLPPQPGYYGNPPGMNVAPLPPVLHQGGLPPPPSGPYVSDPNVYSFDRHPPAMAGGWNGPGVGQGQGPPGPGPGPGPGQGGQSMDPYYNPAAGPSRGASAGGDPYQAYAQPARSSPSQPINPRQQPMQPAGWSSVHPTAPPPSAGRGVVKLEDLVSGGHSRPSTAQTSAPGPGPSGFPSSSLPVSVSNSFDQKPAMAADAGNSAAGGQAGGGGGGEKGGGGQQGPSEFIKKLYKMLEEESAAFGKGKGPGQPRGEGSKRGSVGWGRGGSSFVVWDMNDFTTKVLPQTFRHSNFSSFVRQLNKYGFSKIKHVDEETGTIKENVWEFQHPSFQAGGKSDLENIKRKAVAPRKGAGADGEDTSPKAGGLTAEDASRLNVMENRIVSLEGKLDRALNEVRDARVRESGMFGLMREMIGHLAASERETSGSPMSDGNYSPRMLQLFRSFDQVSSGAASSPSNFGSSSVNGAPFSAGPSHSNRYGPFQTSFSNDPTLAQTSPRTDGARSNRGSLSGPSPTAQQAAGMRSVSGPGASSRLSGVSQVAPQMQSQGPILTSAAPASAPNTAVPPQQQTEQGEDVIELPEMPTLYNGEPLGMTPMFVETPAWLTEGTTTPIPIYHRKASDGATLRLMYEALNGGPSNRFSDGSQVPLEGNADVKPNGLETIPEVEAVNATSQPMVQPPNPFEQIVAPPPGGPEAAEQLELKGKSAVSAAPTISTRNATGSGSSSSGTGNGTGRSRKTAPIIPHWAQTPRILVVEDDLVYRQLSSKFLEKFGCITETVENAQGAVDKMNRTKYDLVLMDIFFGPNMDGRKATSLIRQFDNYTPIISMTSNARPQDVDSYFQSGMNDILAKPFTKHGLFCILDKHLIHLRQAQIYEKLIPVSVGVPPLSDQHVQEALAVSAANLQGQNAGLIMGGGGMGPVNVTADGENEGEPETEVIRNPLAGSGWSDEMYSVVLQQFLATGAMPDVHSLTNVTIGSNVLLGDPSFLANNLLNGNVTGNGDGNSPRKRPIEAINDDEWDPSANSNQGGAGVGMVPTSDQGQMDQSLQTMSINQNQNQNQNRNQNQNQNQNPNQPIMSISSIGVIPLSLPANGGQGQVDGRESKRARGVVG